MFLSITPTIISNSKSHSLSLSLSLSVFRHDVCFYFDVTVALILLLVYTTISRTRGMTRANEIMLSAIVVLVALGCQHYFQGEAIRHRIGLNVGEKVCLYNPEFHPEEEPSMMTILSNLLQHYSMIGILLGQLPIYCFWSALIKLSMPGLTPIEIGVVATTAQLGHVAVPVQLGCPYVQALVVVGISFHELAQDYSDKDFIYATFPMTVVVPINLIRWLECTQCTNFVRDQLYGCLASDAILAGSVFVWYNLCYLHICGSVSMSRSLKKVEFREDSFVMNGTRRKRS